MQEEVIQKTIALVFKASRLSTDVLQKAMKVYLEERKHKLPPYGKIFVKKLIGRGQMVSFAHALKDKIKEELGLTVNVGVSTNFLLSKMAGDSSKLDKVHTFFPEKIEKRCGHCPSRSCSLWKNDHGKTA